MRLTQTLKQKPTVSPQLILANELLQLSSLELEQAIAQELAENPALELRQVRQCPDCGAEMLGGTCQSCSWAEIEPDEVWRDDGPMIPDGDAGPPPGTAGAGTWNDPISGMPSCISLTEHLLRQARLSLSVVDVPIACHVIGNLDDRGWLSCDVEDAASALGVERERVEGVLAVVQSLEPVGIAARNARECLLIQIADLGGEEGNACPKDAARSVAERLIRDHWDSMGRSSPESLGRAADISADRVRAALRFIRENLNPFPAYAGWADPQRAPSEGGARCPQPDVIIRESEAAPGGYEIDLPKADAYRLRVSASYTRAMDDMGTRRSSGEDGPAGAQGWEIWRELCGRARLFVRSIEQRWETLHALMRCLIDYQKDFLIRGERALKPLTRAQIAESMGVHESTVSRAVAGKYVELPCGEVVSLETFFDSAAPIKRRIEELVAHEEEPLSDRAIAERLSEQGYDVARRTVAKYRNAINILPSSLRQWSREL